MSGVDEKTESGLTAACRTGKPSSSVGPFVKFWAPTRFVLNLRQRLVECASIFGRSLAAYLPQEGKAGVARIGFVQVGKRSAFGEFDCGIKLWRRFYGVVLGNAEKQRLKALFSGRGHACACYNLGVI